MEDLADYFKHNDTAFRMARWQRAISPVVFGGDDATLGLLELFSLLVNPSSSSSELPIRSSIDVSVVDDEKSHWCISGIGTYKAFLWLLTAIIGEAIPSESSVELCFLSLGSMQA